MKVVSQEEMVNIDRITIDEYQVPSIILMENAGISITDGILHDYPQILNPDKKTTILIGIGNNGGDGSVIARKLFERDVDVSVYCVGKKEKLKGDALTNYTILKNLGFDIPFISDKDDWTKYRDDIIRSDIIIEGLFGTGLNSEVRGIYRDIINDINTLFSGDMISIDIPSGLMCMSDEDTETLSINASTTYTVGLPKVGMIDYPGRKSVGNLKVVSIGFPKHLLRSEKLKVNLTTKQKAMELLPKRKRNSHKGTYGHLLVISGCQSYTGAATLSCKSAYKTGCGLVTLASVRAVNEIVKNNIPEVIHLTLPETKEGYINRDATDRVAEYIDKISAIVIGPGLGTDNNTFDFIKSLLELYSGNMIIDADGLNLISQDTGLLKTSSANIIVTPHIKEMSRLTTHKVEEIISKKRRIVREFSTELGVVTLLKDSISLTGLPDGTLHYNTAGNDGMSTGGTGDVLSGIIGGLLAQGLSPSDAAILGPYLCGTAADICKKSVNTHSMMPTDIIHCISLAITEIQQ